MYLHLADITHIKMIPIWIMAAKLSYVLLIVTKFFSFQSQYQNDVMARPSTSEESQAPRGMWGRWWVHWCFTVYVSMFLLFSLGEIWCCDLYMYFPPGDIRLRECNMNSEGEISILCVCSQCQDMLRLCSGFMKHPERQTLLAHDDYTLCLWMTEWIG